MRKLLMVSAVAMSVASSAWALDPSQLDLSKFDTDEGCKKQAAERMSNNRDETLQDAHALQHYYKKLCRGEKGKK